jgi:hypothetical protein
MPIVFLAGTAGITNRLDILNVDVVNNTVLFTGPKGIDRPFVGRFE